VFSSQNISFPFYLKKFLELFSLSFSIIFHPLSLSLSLSLSFLYASCLEDLGVLMIFNREKSLLQKHHFKLNGMDWLSVNIHGGHIFWNGVMQANMAKPCSWRWRCCEYIGGGCIF
jgi:hypothetical protein